MNKIPLLFALALCTNFLPAKSQNRASILVDLNRVTGEISPMLFGQFIEHLGRCIKGGIYDEGSDLSNQMDFRTDVLDKMKQLNPPLLRYPGGTFTKIYHWEDGIGPKENRRARKNLIWGGIEDNHFGTAEFIQYCREINAEPFLVINIATGTPEEASNWVEYCNGTGNTYYANLRRSHGYPEPFNVKYWGVGNEESAEPDCGRHQDPNVYVRDAWQFIKLMKLTDPLLKLVLVGDYNLSWTKTVLDGMSPVCDYLAIHHYVNSHNYISLFESIEEFERKMLCVDALIKKYPDKVKDFNGWYRFPPRQGPIKIALDEWGIGENGGLGTYNLEVGYEWRHALGTAVFLNSIMRNSDKIALATWAQAVNVLAPIMTDDKGSVCQTVYYPLQYFRQYCGNKSVKTLVESPLVEKNVKALDVASCWDEKSGILTMTIVNKSKIDLIKTSVHLLNGTIVKTVKKITMTAPSVEAKNTLDAKSKNVVKIEKVTDINNIQSIEAPAASIIIYQYEATKVRCK
jgi:alpha-L-arabinofuranosidase